MNDPTDTRLGRDDLLLLMAKGAEGGSYPFDAIRAMKSAFIVSQTGVPEWRDLYDFRPYDYGPFDPSVYNSRDVLVAAGLLEVRSGRYPSYRLTEAGQTRAANLEAKVGSRATWLREVGLWASSRSFAQLLREVYEKFPDFATRSVARVS
jgi:hypothetical protein